MKTGSTKRVLLLLSLAVMLAAGLWLFSRSGTPPATDDSIASKAVENEGLEPAAGEADQLPEPDSLIADTTTPELQPAESGSAEARSQADLPAPLSAEQRVTRREIETQIEAAIAGSNNQAVELSRFLNHCQFVPQSKEAVEHAIERAAQSFAEGKPLKQFRPSSLIQEFDSIESFELEQWDSYYRCDAARRLTDEEFWDRLEREADAGNPVARYLFATLKRGSETGFGFDRWDEELELTEQSREYTWRNMQEREPLGLLAMAQTSRFGTQVTLGGTSVNVVLSLAAVKCGLATPELLDQVDQMIEKLKRMEVTHPGALDQLNNASDEAKRMFCK